MESTFPVARSSSAAVTVVVPMSTAMPQPSVNGVFDKPVEKMASMALS